MAAISAVQSTPLLNSSPEPAKPLENKTDEPGGFAQVLSELKEGNDINAVDPKVGSNPFVNSLEKISNYSNEMNDIIKLALGKQQLSQQELLLLQAKCHRISFELTMASKLVETGTGSIKTTMQTQL